MEVELNPDSEQGAVLEVDFSEVNQAVALIEQFEILQENLTDFVRTLPAKYKDEAEVHLTTFNTLFSILDTDLAEEFGSLSSTKLSGRSPKSTIERLGVSQELIRMRKQGKTIAELALVFKLSPKTISHFFRKYDQLKPSDKAKVQKRSVFNTIDEFEELAIIIKRNLVRLEAQNDEVNVKLIGELRQTIVAASNLAERMANHERYQKFTEAVINVLMDELPSKRTVILRQIQAVHGRSTQNVLG